MKFRLLGGAPALPRRLLFVASMVFIGTVVSVDGAQPKTHTIRIHEMKFDPASLEINVGDTVIWRNDDIVPHTATSRGSFDSRGIDPGKTWEHVADKKGAYVYICAYHPTMKAALAVR